MLARARIKRAGRERNSKLETTRTETKKTTRMKKKKKKRKTKTSNDSPSDTEDAARKTRARYGISLERYSETFARKRKA